MNEKAKELALELKEIFDILSPFIERHTAMVCPQCTDVCCKDKHGRYDKDDLKFLNALGIDIMEDSKNVDDTDPCRYLTRDGCTRERWMRPFRCTFFFCDPLLKSMEQDDPKFYRAFVEYFRCLVDTRRKFLSLYKG